MKSRLSDTHAKTLEVTTVEQLEKEAKRFMRCVKKRDENHWREVVSRANSIPRLPVVCSVMDRWHRRNRNSMTFNSPTRSQPTDFERSNCGGRRSA